MVAHDHVGHASTSCALGCGVAVDYDLDEHLARSSWSGLSKDLLRHHMDVLRIEPDLVAAEAVEMFGRRSITDKERAALWDRFRPW